MAATRVRLGEQACLACGYSYWSDCGVSVPVTGETCVCESGISASYWSWASGIGQRTVLPATRVSASPSVSTWGERSRSKLSGPRKGPTSFVHGLPAAGCHCEWTGCHLLGSDWGCRHLWPVVLAIGVCGIHQLLEAVGSSTPSHWGRSSMCSQASCWGRAHYK